MNYYAAKRHQETFLNNDAVLPFSMILVILKKTDLSENSYIFALQFKVGLKKDKWKRKLRYI